MLTKQQAVQLLEIGNFKAGEYINATVGNQPAHLFIVQKDLENIGFPKHELSLDIKYGNRSITRFITEAGYGLNLDVITNLIDDSTAYMPFSKSGNKAA